MALSCACSNPQYGLGALPDAVDAEATLDVDLQSGDRVVLYTDGITDVFNSNGEMLGVEGVQKIRPRNIAPAVQRNESMSFSMASPSGAKALLPTQRINGPGRSLSALRCRRTAQKFSPVPHIMR